MDRKIFLTVSVLGKKRQFLNGGDLGAFLDVRRLVKKFGKTLTCEESGPHGACKS